MSAEFMCKSGWILLALTLVALQTQNGVVLVGAELTQEGNYCAAASGNYSDGEAFQVNLGQVVANLTDDASGGALFSNVTAGKGSDRVFGLYYCNGLMDGADCRACVEAAAGEIQDSCTTKEAIIWYFECTLRYSNRDIFSKAEVSPYAHRTHDQFVSNKTAFSRALSSTLTTVIKEAAAGKPPPKLKPLAYAASQANLSSTETLVAVAQCTPDITGPACSSCLEAAASNISSCCRDTAEAMVFLPSCQLLYTVSSSNSSAAAPSSYSNPFSSTSTPSGHGKSNGSVLKSRGNVIAEISAALAFLFFVSLNITF